MPRSANLNALLVKSRPGLIVTTSHRAILATADRDSRRRARDPVDQNWTMLDPGAMLRGWKPSGAVWIRPRLLLGRERRRLALRPADRPRKRRRDRA